MKELKLILQNAILRHYKMPPKPDGSLVQSILSSSTLAAIEGLSKILKIEKVCLKVFLLEINPLYGTYFEFSQSGHLCVCVCVSTHLQNVHVILNEIIYNSLKAKNL